MHPGVHQEAGVCLQLRARYANRHPRNHSSAVVTKRLCAGTYQHA